MKFSCTILLLHVIFLTGTLTHGQEQPPLPLVDGVESQPLLAQAKRLQEALDFLGSSLSREDKKALTNLQKRSPGPETTELIQKILDPYCLAMVDINPEARVKVSRGPAKARLMKDGWTSFLVKVHNEAGVTASLEAESPNARPIYHISSFGARPMKENILTEGQVSAGFLEIVMYRNRPLLTHLSGVKLEYAVIQIYSKESGTREAEISFNIGQGSQDIGFRNAVNILFTISKPVKVKLNVKDDGGQPGMASFTISDGVERIVTPEDEKDIFSIDYRLTKASIEYLTYNAQLKGIYPLPSRRLASKDEYPDFFFQPQIYRSSGEHVFLPPGRYKVEFTRGPEYLVQTREIVVPEGKDSTTFDFELKRWINMSKLGWHSGDHHVHAAGCSHYETPEEGVTPADMWRQQLGEDLNVAAVLTWGPGWYHQKGFFTGETDRLSTKKNIMRYDVEVSGFPSSHAGHIVLLRLKEDDYPGTSAIEQWPSWTLPVLKWAKSQGAATGYAHSGWGLEPVDRTTKLPNQSLPKMDGIGANEYVVTVTQDAVDFYSAGDTPLPWELNMWYHSLNCGFRTRLSGETDFPCIFDERVGMARSYFKTEGSLDFSNYVEAIKDGRSYVSDGKSHIIDYTVNKIEAGTQKSEVHLPAPQTVVIRARAAAYLPAKQTEQATAIAKRSVSEQPFWHIERARIGSSRKVPVELIFNGHPVDTAEISADGNMNDIKFDYMVKRSGWFALRINYSSHTNPIFVLVNKKPVAIKESADWCARSVEQCWKNKQNAIREDERGAAKTAYDQARSKYEEIGRMAVE